MTKYSDSLFFYFESNATADSLFLNIIYRCKLHYYILKYSFEVFRVASSPLRYRILTESKLTDRSILLL